jgi:hypothetical protein
MAIPRIAPGTALSGTGIGTFLNGNTSASSESSVSASAPSLVARTSVELSRLMVVADAERRPDERAFARAHVTLVELSDRGFGIPASDVYVDPDRAIRLLWNRDGRSAEMVFPSVDDEAPYLYRSSEREYSVEDDPGVECLLGWLRWVANGPDSAPSRAA